ncbi:MAG: hypothetical protein L6V84_06170 [Oscillospiraceae bacterium]|nr:MAG: hypothetical protein L6V84_06170 [Oscillospiraceae bacterium]
MKKLCSLVLAFVMVMGCLSILSGCASSDDWKTDENGMVELVIGGIGPPDRRLCKLRHLGAQRRADRCR